MEVILTCGGNQKHLTAKGGKGARTTRRKAKVWRSASLFGWIPVYISVLEIFVLEPFVKPRIAVVVVAICFALSTLVATPQDKDADKPGRHAVKKTEKKDRKKDEKKDDVKDKDKDKEEKKGGMTADTFSGLKFRSIGPAVASGRVMSIAVNPKNKGEDYLGGGSGGVWKTGKAGTTCTPLFDKQRSC